jgi:pimeloyl-ACP methyl ester carboxylesterase
MKQVTDTTVVLLHSSASSARQWDALAQALKDARLDVRAIDLHGHGERAPWTRPAPLTLADEAAPVEAWIAAGRRLHLVGHSYGGAVALDIARRHPHAVASLVVYEPVMLQMQHAEAAWRTEWQAFGAASARVQAAVGEGRLHDAGACFVDYWSGAGTWARLGPAGQDAVAARMPSIARQSDALHSAADPRAVLAGMALPTLLLTGAATVPAAQRFGALLEAAWPHASHQRLAGLGHMGPLSHPHVVNPLITDFLLRQVDLPRRVIAPVLETTPA